MVGLSEEKKIYSEIQKKLFYIIPEKWESIYLYASVIDMPNKRLSRRNVFLLLPKKYYKEKSSKLL